MLAERKELWEMSKNVGHLDCIDFNIFTCILKKMNGDLQSFWSYKLILHWVNCEIPILMALLFGLSWLLLFIYKHAANSYDMTFYTKEQINVQYKINL